MLSATFGNNAADLLFEPPRENFSPFEFVSNQQPPSSPSSPVDSRGDFDFKHFFDGRDAGLNQGNRSREAFHNPAYPTEVIFVSEFSAPPSSAESAGLPLALETPLNIELAEPSEPSTSAIPSASEFAALTRAALPISAPVVAFDSSPRELFIVVSSLSFSDASAVRFNIQELGRNSNNLEAFIDGRSIPNSNLVRSEVKFDASVGEQSFSFLSETSSELETNEERRQKTLDSVFEELNAELLDVTAVLSELQETPHSKLDDSDEEQRGDNANRDPFSAEAEPPIIQEHVGQPTQARNEAEGGMVLLENVHRQVMQPNSLLAVFAAGVQDATAGYVGGEISVGTCQMLDVGGTPITTQPSGPESGSQASTNGTERDTNIAVADALTPSA